MEEGQDAEVEQNASESIIYRTRRRKTRGMKKRGSRRWRRNKIIS